MSALPTSTATAQLDQFPPVAYLAEGSQLYSRTIGVTPLRIDYRRVSLDPALGQLISNAYMAAPTWDESAFAAYEAFRRETIQQFGFLVGSTKVGSLGVTVEFTETDPYSDAESMTHDLSERRLKVFSTRGAGNPHPLLTDRENDMFRAVHDAFGHAASGRGFSRDGEEAAWLKHCFMYSALARRALTTETRGQSCAQSFHYGGHCFPEQKVVLLPKNFSDPSSVRLGGEPAFA
ncbi:hypothetical protein F4553_007778 [Allocatelliglobosispora scoriae]|uniref:Uncharacterized protein n=1 Tax=Allocatelliglobosispora scoriae TaxID=643052 RepID=A0A841C1W3_9ACTN|nr:hypothetical protein [Allocatelliglobosispora scoriae]MBB5874344.1 hypothetical protein [Allocatelliglobosispora scoriae]